MLSGKVAVITGGTRGIGKAIAFKLASLGASVALVYAGNSSAAEAACSELGAIGAKAKAYKCDVSDFEAAKALCKEIVADFGPVDILVNNAGITRDGLIVSMKEADYDAVLDTNLKGAFNMIKHLYSNFIRHRGGRIVNISSVSGLMGNAGQANYSAAKSGLIGLTKSVARELASREVTCNAVAPGFIETEMTAGLSEKNKADYESMIPLKRMGTPDDVAETVAFLVSGGAGYITGEVIRIDGGMCM
jgi:3-oxoacyl-[acyl-carrier protein] reductase